MNKSRNEQIRENAKTLDGYQKYVEKLENDRRELVKSTFKNILGLGITDVNDAYKRVKYIFISSQKDYVREVDGSLAMNGPLSSDMVLILHQKNAKCVKQLRTIWHTRKKYSHSRLSIWLWV